MTPREPAHESPVNPEPGLLGYIAALETIIVDLARWGLPGKVLVNGVAMSNDEGLADLRRRFEVTHLLDECYRNDGHAGEHAYAVWTRQGDPCAEAVAAEADRWRRLPGAYRREDGGTEVVVDVPESASFLLDEFPDEVALILAAERARIAEALPAAVHEAHCRYNGQAGHVGRAVLMNMWETWKNEFTKENDAARAALKEDKP